VFRVSFKNAEGPLSIEKTARPQIRPRRINPGGGTLNIGRSVVNPSYCLDAKLFSNVKRLSVHQEVS
jgi:hypothetical protein